MTKRKNTSLKKSGALLATVVLAGGLSSSLAGPAAAPPPVQPAPDANPLSFDDGKVIFDVQERLRWENRSNNFDFNSDKRAVTDGNWFQQRVRIGLALKPLDWLKIYAQARTRGNSIRCAATRPVSMALRVTMRLTCARATSRSATSRSSRSRSKSAGRFCRTATSASLAGLIGITSAAPSTR